jgi:restriction endonuclease-like protein
VSLSPFILGERARAIAWKRATADLPDVARRSAHYHTGDGRFILGPFDYCLPPDHAVYNLLPDARAAGLETFERLGIPWHAGIAKGPGNHLLDSQVQCVNALVPLVRNSGALLWLFGDVLPIADLLPIELDMYLTFEWIGLADHLQEGQGRRRTRGSHATSADAAIRYRSTDGRIEIGLIEWKYREDGAPNAPPDEEATKRRMRFRRQLWTDPQCLVRHDAIDHGELFVEPRYQLFRLQSLAARMRRARELDAHEVRLVVAMSRRNQALAADIAGWPSLLHEPACFAVVDTDRLLAAGAPTSQHYRARYGEAARRNLHPTPRPPPL